MESLPKLDREALRRGLQGDIERLLNEVADAVDAASSGRLIRDSEEPVRDAVARFRTLLYQRAVQQKVNAAEAAFPPSAQRRDREEETLQGAAHVQRPDDQRPDCGAEDPLALSPGRLRRPHGPGGG